MTEDVLRTVIARSRIVHSSGPGLDPDATIKSETSAPRLVGEVPTVSGAAPAVVGDAPTVAGSTTAPPQSSAFGDGFDLEIEAEIGRGGMGVVNRTRQRSLGRAVARKGILQRDDPSARAGFVSEAVVNGMLEHPNLVPVHGLGETAAREVFLVMRLLSGRSWSRLLHPKNDDDRAAAEGRDLDDELDVLVRVTRALTVAHERGLIHRDLKPSNVMVGDHGEVYLIDWGLAVEVVDPGKERRNKSVPLAGDVDVLAGTPAFLAPEMAEARGHDFGTWTDVYLLGGILHELLCGRPPHQGANLMEILAHAAAAEPPDLPEEAPAPLATLCRAALSRDPRERPRDAAAFLETLDGYRAHRDSMKLVESARKALGRTRIQQATSMLATDRDTLYSGYSRAIAAFEDALSLWHENETARRELERTRHEAASAALFADDFGLARSWLADLDDEESRGVREEIETAEEDRRRTRLALRRRRLALAGIVGLMSVGLIAWTLAVGGETARAEREAARADVEASKAAASAARALALSRRAEEENARAGEYAARETAALTEITRLGDVRRLERAREEAAALYPERPETVPAIEAWRARNAGLVERLEVHRAKLADLEEQALPWTEEDRLRDHADRIALLGRLRERWTELDAMIAVRKTEEASEEKAEIDYWIKRLESRIRRRERFDFGDDARKAWVHGVLRDLVRELERFVDPEDGLWHDVDRRLAFARIVREKTLVEPAEVWSRTVKAVRENPLYEGLEIEPQIGLIPLGPDPESGLEEFLDLRTHTGPVLERDGEGLLDFGNDSGIVLVLVPGGTFTMGRQGTDPDAPHYESDAAENESPVHVRRVGAFFIGKHEMTQGQWLRATGNNPSNMSSGSTIGEYRFTLAHPVERVSWFDCSETLAHLDLRLPSEVEWEYSARAGSTTRYWCGDDRETLKGVDNIADASLAAHGGGVVGVVDWPGFDDGWAGHAPVDTLRANAFGLHHVHGNVEEWCADLYRDYTANPELGPGPERSTVPGLQRMVRGGCYADLASDVRISSRMPKGTTTRSLAVGLRVARDLDRRKR